MATSGTRAFGTTLQYTPLDAAAVTIGEITAINGVEITADTIEMTSHSSTDRYREFIQGLRDGGTVTLEGNHVPGDAGQIAILEHFLDQTATEKRRLTLTYPDGSGWVFEALCVAYKPSDAGVADKLGFTATFKVTGVPAYGASLAAGLTTPFFVLSEGNATVAPTRAGTTYAYTANVETDKASLTVTPTSAAGTAIYVNGVVVASGAASDAISLSIGANLIVIEVVQTGYMPARYTVTVTRAAA
jgi:predicted secreted protein